MDSGEINMYYTAKNGKTTTTKKYGYFNTLDAWIELSQGQIAIVDVEDLERLLGYTWCATWNPKSRCFIARNSTTGPMARFIMETPDNKYTDHKNHSTLDNRKENLRICTSTQNLMNGLLPKNNKSGFKGVSWDKVNKKWVVHIGNSYLGRFERKIEAAVVYDNEAKKRFGKYALTNEDMGLFDNIQLISE